MSCKKPYKGWILENKNKKNNSKMNIKITPNTIHHLEYYNNTWHAARDEWRSPYAKQVITKYIEIPCKKCLACQLDYSREWATRCILEAQCHDDNCFLTLTYNDSHVRLVANADGELFMTLEPAEFTEFIKRLREHIGRKEDGKKIRFFGCGEYGSATHRPHYHILLFGWRPPPVDLEFQKFNKFNEPLWSSKMLEKIWPYGFNIIGDVTFRSAGYVSRYIMKKLENKMSAHTQHAGIEPEFVRMSRNKGIAYPWYERFFTREMFNNPYVHIAEKDRGRKLLIPRYVFNCAASCYPDEYERFLENRMINANKISELKDAQTDLPHYERLDAELEDLAARTKRLIRPL